MQGHDLCDFGQTRENVAVYLQSKFCRQGEQATRLAELCLRSRTRRNSAATLLPAVDQRRVV